MQPKYRDLVNTPIPELEKKLVETKKELLKIRTRIASGTIPENPGNIKNVKKTIARILLCLAQRKEVASKTNG